MLTDNTHIGEDGEPPSPVHRSPESVDPPLCPRALNEARHDAVFEDIPEVKEARGADGETLNQNVREVEVGRLGQILGQQIRRREGLFEHILDRCRGGRGQGRDEEDLDDLESEVEGLDVELDLGKRWFASDACTA